MTVLAGIQAVLWEGVGWYWGVGGVGGVGWSQGFKHQVKVNP